MEEDRQRAVIIDNGTATIRVGFSGEDNPSFVFPNIVGHSRDLPHVEGAQIRDYYVGDEAHAKRGILDIKSPMERGNVVNFNNMTCVWRHTFSDVLRSDPKEHPVLITETAQGPKANRERMTQIFFEEFEVPLFHISNSASLAIFAAGFYSGVSVDIGEDVTTIVPVHGGFPLLHALQRFEHGGKAVTEHLAKLLEQKGHLFRTSAEKEIIKKMKEELCYVPLMFDLDMGKASSSKILEKTFGLPDGSSLILNEERIVAPELFFQPELIGAEGPALPELVDMAIRKTDPDIRKEMYWGICVSGGTSLLNGFADRLQRDG